MARKVCAQISKKALLHNFQIIKQNAPNSKVLAMVKANAYGHGLLSVAQTLAQADAFGVANLEEALILRQGHIHKPIVLMEGFFTQDELSLIAEHNFIPVIHCCEQIEAMESYTDDLPCLDVWIKINTGMNRLGFSASEFRAAYERLVRLPYVNILGYMTHFSHADKPENGIVAKQTELFQTLVKDLPGAKCLANSAAILGSPSTHADWIRPGLILYGASPFSQHRGEEFHLKPVMVLSTEVIAVQNIRKGQQVGYNGLWMAPTDTTRIGILSIGYGDGYPWHAQTGTPVVIDEALTHVIGRVSMDMLAVDLTHLPKARRGTPAQLWGDKLPIEDVAKGANTIPYELFCRLTSRVKTLWVD